MKLVPLILVLWLFSVNSFAAPFRNLGFEEAVTNITESVPPDPFKTGAGYGRASDLLPGWQVFLTGATTPTEKIGLNIKGGLDIVSIYEVALGFPGQGSFSFGTVVPFWAGPFSDQPRYSLVQRGDIPSDANWISFKRDGDPVRLSINGVDLPLLEFSDAPSRPIAGIPGRADVVANISAFTGQNVELRLIHDVSILLRTDIDSITFWAQVPPVPEPSTLCSILLGTLWLMIFWKKERP